MKESMPDENEKWKPIKGWPNYVVSNYGRIKHLAHYNGRGWFKERILKPWADKRYIGLRRGSRTVVINIAQTILTTFVRPPKPGEESRHLDDNVLNMHVSNLAWGTHLQNMQDKVRNGISGKGIPKTEETRAKIRASKLGVKLSPEHRRNIGIGSSRALKGLPKSAAHRAALSKAKMGCRKGVPLSEAHKAALRKPNNPAAAKAKAERLAAYWRQRRENQENG